MDTLAYTPGQVGVAMESTGCNPDYIDYAYATFCNEEDFNEVCSGDYASLHQDVADTCFAGDNSFNVSDATSGSDGGAGE